MKILAKIPTGKKESGPGWCFTSEVREVEVIRLMRRAISDNPNYGRYYYEADVEPHPDMHPESILLGRSADRKSDRLRVHLDRKLNPKWKPQFDGVNSMLVKDLPNEC